MLPSLLSNLALLVCGCPRQHVQGAGHRGEEVWVWNAVCCQCPQARGGDLQERFSLWFVVSLPVGVQNAVRRNHVSVVPSGNLVCHSPDLLLLISRWAPNLILWMLWERSKPFGSICTAGIAGGIHSVTVSFPYRRNHEALSSLKLWCFRGGLRDARKVKLSSYKQERIQTYIFCGSTECWNFSSGVLDFHKSTLIRRPLPKVGFCSCSWTTAMRGWNQFTISCRYHSWYWSLSAYYLCIVWQDFSQVSWHLMLYSPTPTFIHG